MLCFGLSACEIVTTGPSHKLPRGSDEVTVRCVSCGGTWTTSERNKRRIIAGEAPGTCKACKRPALRVTETHRRYWLLMFGCELHGLSAAEYLEPRRVSAGGEGLPAELAAIVEDLDEFWSSIGATA